MSARLVARLAARPASALPRPFACRGYSDYQQQQQPYGVESPRPRSRNPRSSNRPSSSSTFSAERQPLPARLTRTTPPPHLLTLADLTPSQLSALTIRALAFKHLVKSRSPSTVRRSLGSQTIALLFAKRSTRTRVASETATQLLGGHPMFLGSQDIQLGVNETLDDSAKVIGSMADGIMARVNEHEEVEALARGAGVPVVNALSRLYHPTQILADIMTLVEVYGAVEIPERLGGEGRTQSKLENFLLESYDGNPFACLEGKKLAWVGDSNNISNELLVTVPRIGMTMSLAAPKGYDAVEPEVWKRVEEANSQDKIFLTNSPQEALKDADVVVTDTWISMGQEEEKQTRLDAFAGYQLTNELIESSGAKPDWKFMHCLPRKQEEVDDEVFYGPRSVVFQEAENRKWTIMACFDMMFGNWKFEG